MVLTRKAQPRHQWSGRAGRRIDRNDSLLKIAVSGKLRRSGHAPLRHVGIVALNGSVTLCGQVPTYYLKQLAQEAALSVEGVRDVRNDLKVT